MEVKKEKNEISFIFGVIILILANILQFLFLKNTMVRFSILIIFFLRVGNLCRKESLTASDIAII